MTEQLKKIAFLTPRSDLTMDQFRLHWRNKHGLVVAQSPGYAQYRTRYVQNHVVESGPIGRAFDYAGIAEFWLPQQVPNEEAFSASEIYRDRIRVDEEKFIDMNRTVSMTALEQVARSGVGAAKLVVISNLARSLPHAQFLRQVTSTLIPAVLREPEFDRELRGWTLNHVLEGSFRLPGARPVEGVAVDCVQELWFDSIDDARCAFASDGYQLRIRPVMEKLLRGADDVSIFVDEEVFFDHGQAVGRAAE